MLRNFLYLNLHTTMVVLITLSKTIAYAWCYGGVFQFKDNFICEKHDSVKDPLGSQKRFSLVRLITSLENFNITSVIFSSIFVMNTVIFILAKPRYIFVVSD